MNNYNLVKDNEINNIFWNYNILIDDIDTGVSLDMRIRWIIIIRSSRCNVLNLNFSI